MPQNKQHKEQCGFFTIAQNTEDCDYVRLAYLLALSIKATQAKIKSFAVAVDDGLVVPVLKFVNEMHLQEISKSVKDLAERARSKKIAPSEMEGSTFTISNLGMFGITEFTSIINQPNSAILSVGAIVQKPIVKDEKIIIGNTMKLTLACDHRVIDGATGSAFLTTLRNFIENPVGILL